MQRDGETVTVSWAAVWKGFALEWSPALAAGSWTAVPGVSGNTVRLPVSEAPPSSASAIARKMAGDSAGR
ncbi:MAG: hypothetical protein ACYC23_09975 [Limisphaerales bacterium]